jgi:LacI family transcriptional regulator
MTERITASIEALSYVPDAFARGLRAGKTHQVAMSVTDIGNPAYVACMRAIESVCLAENYRVMLFSSGGDPERELDIVSGLRNGTVDGLILQTIRGGRELLDGLIGLPVPAVVIGTIGQSVPLDNVRTDSAAGISLAVQHIIETGRQRIALAGPPGDSQPGAARIRGFERTMRASGRAVDPALLAVCADFTHQAGYAAVRELLSGERPDAIVCANDLIALGALRALAERGLRVPGDVAVTGMDDTDLAQMCTPPLTSVSLRAEERGALAARLLLSRIREPERPVARACVDPRLVVRESSQPRTS